MFGYYLRATLSANYPEQTSASCVRDSHLEGVRQVNVLHCRLPLELKKTTMLESKFKSNQRKEFMAMGWVFIQLDPGAGVPTGFPDTLVLSPTGYACYTEWKKSKTATRKPLQKYWHQKLNDMGHDAFFVYPENVLQWKYEILNKGKMK